MARLERLLAESELIASPWWEEQHDRFFALCLRPRKRGPAVYFVSVWLWYAWFFRTRGYWVSKKEFERHLKRAGYVIPAGTDLFHVNPVATVMPGVEANPAFGLMFSKRPGEWNVAEMRRRSGIPLNVLATLRASGMGPPWRDTGGKILYSGAGYRHWLNGEKAHGDELARRFAAARLKFDIDIEDRTANRDGICTPRDLREALEAWCRGEGLEAAQPAAWSALIRLLRTKGCVSSTWNDEYRTKVRIWDGVCIIRLGRDKVTA